jgi:anti-anti-sigma factor
VSEVATATEFEWREFRCEVVPERETIRVRLVGELDLATAGQVAAAVAELRAAGFASLVLDLSELTFLDSSGIRVIVEAQQAAERDRVSFTVVPGPRSVQRALTLAGVADLLFPLDHATVR